MSSYRTRERPATLPKSGWEGKVHSSITAFLGKPSQQTVAGRIHDPEGTIRAGSNGKLGMYIRLKNKWEREHEGASPEEYQRAMTEIAERLGV